MISDRELAVRSAGSGDQAAFRLLVERHQCAIRRFLRRLLTGDHGTADDLAQETFLLAYQKLHTWRGQGSLLAWLHSIAYRRFLQHIRKHSRHRVTPDPPDEGFDPREAMDAEILAPRLMRLVGPEERACMTLAYAAGMSHAEIVRITGMPLGTVKSHITRGRQKLQNWLKDHDHSISGNNDGGERPAKEALGA